MTIYKTQDGQKKAEEQPMAEVSLDALPSEKKVDSELPPPVVSRRKPKSSCCSNVCILLIAVLVLACGIGGGIFLWRHLHKGHHFRGRCGVTAEFIEEYQSQFDKQEGLTTTTQRYPKTYFWEIEEEIEIDFDKQTEKLRVPQFRQDKDVTILHDFEMNLTAIVDNDLENCFVMPLDRKTVKPPQSLMDLMYNYMNGNYIPNVRMINQHYNIMRPPMTDLTSLGEPIMFQCKNYNTYRLQRMLGIDDGHRPGGHRGHHHHGRRADRIYNSDQSVFSLF